MAQTPFFWTALLVTALAIRPVPARGGDLPAPVEAQPVDESPAPEPGEAEEVSGVAASPVAPEIPPDSGAGLSPERQALARVRGFELVETSVEGVRLTLLICPAGEVALDLIDQPEGPGTLYADAEEVARAHPGLLGVANGGFFDPQGQPLGLRRDAGVTTSALVPPGSLYHGVMGDDGTTVRIEDLAEWNARPGRDLEAIQTGPRLVWDGRAVEGLSGQRRALRTFVATAPDKFILGQASFCSLADLARSLAALGGQALPGGPARPLAIERALNLDGGRSCDLWVAAGLAGRDSWQLRAPLANQVRDFLGLRRR